jgi:hypothetical protein
VAKIHTNGFPSTAPASTTTRFHSVLLEIGEVSMTRTRVEIHCAATIVFGTLVFVADDHGDWCAEGDTEFGAGLDLYAVLFVAGSCESGLTGALRALSVWSFRRGRRRSSE